MTLVEYGPEHRDAVLEIFASNEGTFFEPAERAELEKFLDAVEGLADWEEETVYWVGLIDGTVVASGGLEILGECAFLCWGAVRADLHGTGLGAQVLLHRLDWVRRERPGVKSIFCDTAPKTEGFFARYGFVTGHRRPNHWAGVLELVAMELSLDGESRLMRRVRADGTVGTTLAPPAATQA